MTGSTQPRVDVRFCGHDDVAGLMRFIHTDWAPDHVLSWHRPLLDFQHRRTDGSGYNFVLGYVDGVLVGVLGYIPTRLYDAALDQQSTLWLALWKVRPEARVSGLGIRLLQYLTHNEPHQAIGVCGVGDLTHLPMYRALGFRTGTYTQYVLPNRALSAFHLAHFPAILERPRPSGRATLHTLVPGEVGSLSVHLGARAAMQPAKSTRYFEARYFGHPVYDYRLHAVELDGEIRAVLATRIATHDAHRALRIVDYWGDAQAFAEVGGALAALVEEAGAEYVDLFCHGVDPKAVLAAGMCAVPSGGSMIVPNYFEPFVQSNGQIDFAFKPRAGAEFVLFRADGDQDRPNRLERVAA